MAEDLGLRLVLSAVTISVQIYCRPLPFPSIFAQRVMFFMLANILLSCSITTVLSWICLCALDRREEVKVVQQIALNADTHSTILSFL